MDDKSWASFSEECRRIFDGLHSCTEGEVASYIPQLAEAPPNQFALSVLTVDGRSLELGDVQERVCVQSCCKPLLYGMALSERGEEEVGRHVGKEPSGAKFNDFKFDKDGKPFNPLINAGAIMSTAMIRASDPPDRRFQHIMQVWSTMVGRGEAAFDNATYLGERRTAFRNVALSHLMMENGAFPPATSIEETLQLYLQACSVSVKPMGMARYAAMLANGGTVPGGASIFPPSIVRDVLCVMYSSGMYDYSGRWSSEIGLPAKSGVSGMVMVVVPKLCGLCLFSPRLDPMGNSVRAIRFMRQLVRKYRLHIFETLVMGLNDNKQQLHRRSQADAIYRACAANDAESLARLLEQNEEVLVDYDRRTPLHIAVDDESAACAAVLARQGADIRAADRWGKTPLGSAGRAMRCLLLAHDSERQGLRQAWSRWRPQSELL
jgi:glutaminase